MLRAAVIGLGWWGKQIIKCLRDSNEIRVTHGVDIAAASMTVFGREFGVTLSTDFNALLANSAIDAIIVATPHSQHEAQVLAAIAAGKQVFCEKPLTLTAAGAERILAACDPDSPEAKALPMWPGDKYFLPLVFGNDPRQFHALMPYANGQPASWQFVWI